MKKLLLILTIIWISSTSCKKQELDSANPMIGKWKAIKYEIEDKCTALVSSPAFISPVKPIKEIEIEIQGSGDFITLFDGKKEKLRFIEINESVSMAEFYSIETTIKKYDCKVRNKKGQVFNFHFYFSEETNQMIGTYWTPNHAYVTQEVPNHTVVNCKSGSQTYGGYEIEYFAFYKKN